MIRLMPAAMSMLRLQRTRETGSKLLSLARADSMPLKAELGESKWRTFTFMSNCCSILGRHYCITSLMPAFSMYGSFVWVSFKRKTVIDRLS